MAKKKSLEVTVLGIIMIFYGVWLLTLFFLEHFEKLRILDSGSFLLFFATFIIATSGALIKWHPILSFIIMSFMGLIYLISGIFILKFRNWARVLAVYFSMLIGWVVIYIFIDGIIRSMSSALGGILIMVSIPLLSPPLLFLYFFTRSRIKEQFKQ